MTLQPQKFRELLFQMLYSFDMSNMDEESIAEMLMKELKVTRKAVAQGLERAKAISSKQPEFDALITKYAADYPINRIHSVERTILRLAIFEILYDDQIPPKVAISEAIRLAKKFSTTESTRFINGVLDSIYKDHHGIERAQTPPHPAE